MSFKKAFKNGLFGLIYFSSARIHKVVVDCCVRLEQIGLDASWWFHSHLAAILQDHDGKFRTWHACKPKAKVFVHVFGINLLDESFQRRHPTWCQVAILKEHPLSPFHSSPGHGFGAWSLALTKRNGRQFLGKLHLFGKFVQISSWICALRENKNEWRRRR
jgi:hypothetical protein